MTAPTAPMIGPLRRDVATAAFLDGTARGEFLLRHCNGCDRMSSPQAEQCEFCLSTDLGWVAAQGSATLVSWSISHGRPDAEGRTEQIVLGVVELAEGPWWWTQIIADRGRLEVGLPLTVDFAAHSAEYETVPFFRA